MLIKVGVEPRSVRSGFPTCLRARIPPSHSAKVVFFILFNYVIVITLARRCFDFLETRLQPLAASPINNHSSKVPSHGPVPMVRHLSKKNLDDTSNIFVYFAIDQYPLLMIIIFLLLDHNNHPNFHPAFCWWVRRRGQW